MSWDDARFIYEQTEGKPSFRIIEDDGCYVVLVRGRGGHWCPTFWIFPEAHDVIKRLERPRGAIYDLERDGPLPEGAPMESFVAEKVAERREEKKKGRPS
jgi:hypothetical protein